MTIDEIYSKLAKHMIKGMMAHEQLANYYDFLCLKGYKRCHEYHYLEETVAYRGLCRYYINHHNKLIELGEVENPNIIPSNWYKYYRKDVDGNTRANSVKSGMKIWVDWETETKKLYEDVYRELITINEVASAMKVKSLVKDVDMELKFAERKYIELASIDFDMSVITPAQSEIHDKYRKKMRKIGVSIC